MFELSEVPMSEIEEVTPRLKREDFTDLQWGRVWQAHEAHKRWNRLGLGIKKMVDDENQPTEQTVRKLRRNVIEWMFTEQKINSEQKDAAEEILSVFESLGRGMWSGSSELRTRTDGGKWADPIDKMTEREGINFSKHYAPWMREAEKVRVACKHPPGQPLTAAILTWDLVIGNKGPDQLGRIYGLPRHDKRRSGCACVMCWARKSLFRYAEIAGRIHPQRALGASIWD